jgi:hypothetical protein
MAKPTPTTHCNVCSVDLSTVNRYGGKCMSCYSQKIVNKRKRLKKEAVEYAGGKCNDCGGVFPDAVYDFHHVDGTKDGCVGTMTHSCRPWKVIKEEIEKCVLLCANCHRLRHFS